MQLLLLLFLLVGPYVTLAGLSRWTGFKTAATIRARIGISLFFAFTALGHFIRAEEMSAMLPPAVPYRLPIVYVTGILELLGATALWLPGLMRPTGKCLILMLVCFLPANIYSAIYRIDFGGHGAGPAYLLVRLPFQLFLMWWIYWATEQKWFDKKATGL
ncbi:MAG TPA: DoxX family protein [Candidatus Polarisedimenticolaceae bacterium]|nr:DoxX family protein [Candidatus Polarisedimenticolaceae bacterium]